MAGKLNAKSVEAARPPALIHDGGGLYLQVKANPSTGHISKSWVFRYSFGGRRREMGLGKVSDVPLAKARGKAQDARELRASGVDPILHRTQAEQQERLTASRAKTFRQVAEEYIASKRLGWKNPKHAKQWPSTLAAYVYPIFGSKPVGEITVDDVEKALKPIWTEKAETAGRVRSRIEAVLDYAAVKNLRSRENPARLDGYLSKLLPTRRQQVKHHTALPVAEAPAFVRQLNGQAGLGAKALKFAILTAARTAEVTGATWSEVDLKNKVWTVPAERMKGHREHRVPLSTSTVELLQQLEAHKGRNEHIFGVPKSKKAPSNMCMLAVIKRMGFKGRATTHGFRSTFRDWADERDYPRNVAEAALAHKLGSGVESSYLRTEHFEKRKEMMQKWSDYLIAPIASFDFARKSKKNLQL